MKKERLWQTVLAALLASICLLGQNAAAEDQLVKTPADFEGPFYPVTKQEDIDNDLVHVRGQAGIAQGDILNLSGVLVNTRGEAQKNITIEIWQTDPQGRYKHPGDPTPGERDPNFQYWGAATTGSDGTFFFKTIVPGAYEPRPRHIHFKVLRGGQVILTSQIYFRDHAKESGPDAVRSETEPRTVDLKKGRNGELEAFFRIVI